jgi:hypothetical protein
MGSPQPYVSQAFMRGALIRNLNCLCGEKHPGPRVGVAEGAIQRAKSNLIGFDRIDGGAKKITFSQVKSTPLSGPNQQRGGLDNSISPLESGLPASARSTADTAALHVFKRRIACRRRRQGRFQGGERRAYRRSFPRNGQRGKAASVF